MDQAYEYLKHSSCLQAEVTSDLLDEFGNEVSKMKGTIMDVGCGPGNNTRNTILPKLPKDTVMIGLDVSKNMVNCARDINSGEKRLTFEQLNIETTDLPSEFVEKFDNGFSFFCLQWIHDLRQAFENIYKMLRPGGTFISHQIVLFVGYSPYLRLAEYPQYKEYMKDVNKIVPPFFFEKNPRAALVQIIKEVGFQLLHCSLREKMERHKSQKYRRGLIESVNPFVTRMPKDLQKEFMNDLMQETLKEEGTVIKKSESPENEDLIFDSYTFLILHVKKP